MDNEMMESVGMQDDMPCDPDSEQALLASIIIEPENISVVSVFHKWKIHVVFFTYLLHIQKNFQ